MKKITLAVLFMISGFFLVAQNDKNVAIPLWDGNTLEHWKVPKNNTWWRTEGDVLWAESDALKTGSNLWTKKEYKDFEVSLLFKFGEGVVDSGIFMRGENPRNPQIQIGISGSLKRDMTGSPYVPKSGYPKEAAATKDVLKLDDWNTMKAVAKGNLYTVWLNGTQVMEYRLEDANLKGPIGLQLHPGNEMTIQFKNILVTAL